MQNFAIMDKESLREEVISQIRACLVSTKGKCDLRQIKNDYYMLMGCDIPYIQLGYKNLEQFVCSISSLTTTRLNGQLYVDAKVTEKSSHISKFVDKQKTSKKKRPQMFTKKNSTIPPRWRPKNNNNWKKSFETSPRLAAVAHTQVVSSRKSPEKKVTLQLDLRTFTKEDTNSLTKQAKLRLSQKIPDLPLEDLSLVDVDCFIPQNKFIRTGNNLADLAAYVLQNNLGEPIIKTTTKKNHKSAPTYYCKIQVDDFTCTTYPLDIHDDESARQIAAKMALDGLEQQRPKKQNSLLISDDADILHRIPRMVQEHQYGVWNREIERNYLKEYNEQLPMNWLEIVDSLPHIAVIQIHNQFVLNYCDPQMKNNVNDLVATNVSVLPNTLKFNDDDMLVAEITCIASAGEVWCCQRDTAESQAFCNMVQELEQYYNTSSINEKAKTIQIGGHYVALYEQMWCRVRVFEVDGDNIHCFCIDFGDEWIVQKNFLFNLNKKFANEQAQAFVCRLAGVEELYEVSKTSERLQTFLGKVVAVQPDANSDDSETDRNDPAISVVLYDLETGAPINEQIITLMSIEMALPSLTINTPTEVHVTHALDNGEVYVQIRSKGFDYLMSLIEKAGSNIVSNKSNVLPVLVSKTNSTGMFFIQSKDNLWYRVQILDWSPFNEKLAQILYIDTGKSEVINIKDTLFYSLDEISDVISKFPPQGYLVRVSLKTVPGDFVNQIENLMPSDTAVLVKSLRVDDDYVSVVEFFKRSESDNILFSVNMLISADNTQNGSGDGNNNHNCKTQSKKLQKLMSLNHFEDVSKNVPSTGSLTCPTLPELGNYFDVKIPCAVHPYNFFVQPYESQSRLNKLMVMLQERYKDVQYSPIQITDICPGKIYASRHKDGKWYRTSVIKVIHSGSISVFYCDFGYYGNLSVHDLVPLDDDFMDLPYQAIKAKLADVQPKNSNWSMDDCEYFTNLVCKKPFVSILKGIEKDVLYRSDTILLLKLIDTSTSTDVHIDQLLIDRGIAISYPQ